jgi:hypothetical protein
MTGYTVHTGSNEQFSTGWDQIFKKSRKSSGAGSKKKGATKKKSAARAGSRKAGRKR